MTTRVEIISSARLHMGFFDLHGGLGRQFGSIGLSLELPQLKLVARAAQRLAVTTATRVPETLRARALAIAEHLITNLHLAPAEIHVEDSIPEHTGLGSGTQLALAVGKALCALNQMVITTPQIAALTGRGQRSGVGIAAFDVGGVLIDGGRAQQGVPPLLARYEFPEAWAVLLILDDCQAGLHGAQEKLAFNTLPPFSADLAADLCRHVLMLAMPALVEHDLTAFGQAIQYLQQQVGDYFAPVQGGRYASPATSEVLEYLRATGVACLGQSSWGPTGFAIFENQQDAELELAALQRRFPTSGLSWKICRARNRGAVVNLINESR